MLLELDELFLEEELPHAVKAIMIATTNTRIAAAFNFPCDFNFSPDNIIILLSHIAKSIMINQCIPKGFLLSFLSLRQLTVYEIYVK